jgi:chaperone required for assembly of F1-ATPase
VVEGKPRPIKTPRKDPLVLPTMDMAMAIAVEWDAQGDHGISPHTMPLMALACTAVDNEKNDLKELLVGQVMKFLPTDSSM